MSEGGQSGKVRRPRNGGRRAGVPTVADVAREAQCSAMTVSRVVNGVDNVRADTRQRVEEAIARLGYQPNSAARSLAAGEQVRVALLYDNPSCAYLSEVLAGALEESGRRDVQLVVQGAADADDAMRLIRRLADSGVEGFILPPPLCDDERVLALLAELDEVAVAVGPGEAPQSHGAALIDDYGAAREMTRHLVSLGHTRIGFIVGNPGQIAAEHRLAGFIEEMEQSGLPVDRQLVVQGRFTYRSGIEAAETLLAATPRPSAVFASNDDMAAATVAVAHCHHIRVPQDLTVVGFDDSDMARSIWPQLTTVHQPIRQMTVWAVEAAIRAIRARHAGEDREPEVQVLPTTLVRRQSDAPPPAGG